MNNRLAGLALSAEKIAWCAHYGIMDLSSKQGKTMAQNLFREYRINGKPSTFFSVVSESDMGVVTARRKAFASEQFDYAMAPIKHHMAELIALGAQSVTWINAISLDYKPANKGSKKLTSTAERDEELILLLQPLLSDSDNELIFIELHDEYMQHAPVFERLGFVRHLPLDHDECIAYIKQ